MSGFEGPVLRGMNPFSNNKPRLTASERIRNKRDATIYQTEKQQFQNKKICGNKNVKYYDNGTIRSIKSYKLQKSLARGSVLCEDCDDKGLLCDGPVNKDALASIQMGNNKVSEYWGEGELVLGSDASGNILVTQTLGFPVIQSDISGVWGGSITDISKADLSGAILPDSDPSLNMFFGYIDNLIRIPRNLDGNGIVIDPSNELFPDELCDPFRYLKHTNLSTYLVARMLVPLYIGLTPIFPGNIYTSYGSVPSNCNDTSYNLLPGAFVVAVGADIPSGIVGNVFSGQIISLCCVREVNIDVSLNPVDPLAAIIPPGHYGIFDVYIKLFNISNYIYISALLNAKVSGTAGIWQWGPEDFFGPVGNGFQMAFTKESNLYGMGINYIESFNIFQGTIPPSFNQTQYNATRQSYMSCLENGTRKINFTKNTVKQDNVIAGYCTTTPCQQYIPKFAIGTSVIGDGTVTKDTTSTPGYTIYIFDTSGNPADLVIDVSNGILGFCNEDVSLEYLIVAGGGGGGSPPDDTGIIAAGGGGGGEVKSGALDFKPGSSTTIYIETGLGGRGGEGGDGAGMDPSGEGQDGSGSIITDLNIIDISANAGFGAPKFNPVDAGSNHQGATKGGASGGGLAGGNFDISYNGTLGGFRVWPVAGGGGGGSVGVGGNGSVNNLDISSGDASGGIGGIGFLSAISGTSTYYGVGGGGGALPYKYDNTGIGVWVDASGIGGSSCGNALDPSGGHGGPSSTIHTPVEGTGQYPGRDATCYGSGGGGASQLDTQFAVNKGGNGKRGVVIIKVKNSI